MAVPRVHRSNGAMKRRVTAPPLQFRAHAAARPAEPLGTCADLRALRAGTGDKTAHPGRGARTAWIHRHSPQTSLSRPLGVSCRRLFPATVPTKRSAVVNCFARKLLSKILIVFLAAS